MGHVLLQNILFVLALCFFPRLTLLVCFFLFGTVLGAPAGGSLLWWLGWLVAPRLLVAILATNSYWHTAPVLVVLTWIWAVGGERFEKGYFRKRWHYKYMLAFKRRDGDISVHIAKPRRRR